MDVGSCQQQQRACRIGKLAKADRPPSRDHHHHHHRHQKSGCAELLPIYVILATTSATDIPYSSSTSGPTSRSLQYSRSTVVKDIICTKDKMVTQAQAVTVSLQDLKEGKPASTSTLSLSLRICTYTSLRRQDCLRDTSGSFRPRLSRHPRRQRCSSRVPSAEAPRTIIRLLSWKPAGTRAW